MFVKLEIYHYQLLVHTACVCTSETYGLSCEQRCDTSVGKYVNHLMEIVHMVV